METKKRPTTPPMSATELLARCADGERFFPLGASLDGASLDGASLAGASLARASLVGASLVGASLDGASLAGANLAGANLARANLAGATGILVLGPIDGYLIYLIRDDKDGHKIKAGCRWFTLTQARGRWAADAATNTHGANAITAINAMFTLAASCLGWAKQD